MEIALYKDLLTTDADPPIPVALITRVNLYREGTVGEANDARLAALFRQFCLPTVLAQRRLPDAWYLLFDEEVRPPIASLLNDLAEYSWIKCHFPPRLSTNFSGGGPADYVTQLLMSDFQVGSSIIAGRLDCDDALHSSYCFAMQVAVRRHLQVTRMRRRPAFFNFTFGVINDGGMLARPFLNERSPFLFSYFTLGNDALVPIGFPHKDAHKFGSVTEIATEQPMWLYNLHGTNVGRFEPSRFPLTTPVEDVEAIFGVRLVIDQPPLT